MGANEVERVMRVQARPAVPSTSTAPFWLRTSTTGPSTPLSTTAANEVRTVAGPLTSAAWTAPLEFSTSREPATPAA